MLQKLEHTQKNYLNREDININQGKTKESKKVPIILAVIDGLKYGYY